MGQVMQAIRGLGPFGEMGLDGRGFYRGRAVAQYARTRWQMCKPCNGDRAISKAIHAVIVVVEGRVAML